MRSSKTEGKKIVYSFGCVAHSAVLLKSNVANILLFNFCEQKFVQHGPITIAIDCNGLFLVIFEENGPVMSLDQNPHQTVFGFGCVGFSMYACILHFVPQLRQFGLFTYPPRSRASCEKMIFFQNRHLLEVDRRPTSQHCSSVYTIIFVRRKDKTNYLSNQTWAKRYHSRNKQ